MRFIEQGENIYGVEASAQKHFNKSAKEVNKSEAALMAVSLPNPIKFNLSNPTNYMLGRRNWVINQMNNLGGDSFVVKLYDDQ